MRSGLILILFLCLSIGANSQYSSEDPNYWGNRKPDAAYWQQDVFYRIKAELDDEAEVIVGHVQLDYRNNSPYALDELYFHLYQNMFEPNSYHNKFEGNDSTDSGQFQHTEVTSLTISGKKVEFVKDNTILKVNLTKALEPNETIQIECDFKTFFGPNHGRMKAYQQYGFKHFNVVHWYPRISVYDRKFGWTTDQHLGKEFYGDFGRFEVELTLPAKYVVEATGELQNSETVMPEALKQKLNIQNFKEKAWNQPPSDITLGLEGSKTWIYHADHVHDFAWTCDPTYRIGRSVAKLPGGRTVECIAVAQEQHASGWQNAADYTAQVIEFYSSEIGEYAYPKMVVADARDGMEYPMLTLDGGRDPGYRDLLAHEIAHNWFYGMVGNNETYRAALDEGFTQFLTSRCMEHLEGDSMDLNTNRTGLDKFFFEPQRTRDQQVYNGYFRSVITADRDPQLNTHSDQFLHHRDYGQVYYKTATMLYNLEYVLGEGLFEEALQHYFNQWKFCHPYFDDFRTSIIQYTEVDLNWFFDQWLETDKEIDYAISGFNKTGEGQYELKIERRGAMQMPLSISLFDGEGKAYEYWIPNSDFVKNTDAVILPKWLGWNDVNSTYTVLLDSVLNIKQVAIDASETIADVYALDNKLPLPVNIELNDFSWTNPTRNYEVEWNPSIWYNGYDGLKFGIEAKGRFFNKFHRIESGLWFNSGVIQQAKGLENTSLKNEFFRFNYKLNYATPLKKVSKGLELEAYTSWLDGLLRQKLGWSKRLSNGKTELGQHIHSLYRPNAVALNYLIYPDLWNGDSWNNFIDSRLIHRYGYARNSSGKVSVTLRTPFLGSDYNYGYLRSESINENRFSKFNWRTRIFGQFGTGSSWAPESRLYAAGANPEETMNNPFIRSYGFIPGNTFDYGASTSWFQSGGGLNLRGYNNYLLPELTSDSLVRFAFAGMSGASFNTEFEFDNLIRILPKSRSFIELKTYLFADAGIINTNKSNESLAFSKLRMDAGVGGALEIKKWGRFSELRPLTLRFDFPLFMNRPPAGDGYFAFRWLVGIDRAF